MNEKYHEILYAPRPLSKRKHMSLHDRAAQFSPFAALTGHGDAIKETARLTDEEIELSEEEARVLDRKFSYLLNKADERPKVTITYFVYDKYKYGGKYVSKEIEIRRIDLVKRQIFTVDKKVYDIDLIIEMEGELFKGMEEEGS